MPIQKLEDSTVRAIGASQTLTDPTSLIKELIDNALDAHATSIAIEISTNTLDIIQVRDNGYGIAPDDRAMVARPNCTSKITIDDDIKSIRGTSLGFHGQALASAAELSGSMTISTRIEGEQTASTFNINRTGEVTEERRSSSPIGTMVRITDFVATNPVRKQILLKSVNKTLNKLKDLLQSYAFARPKVRIALRVTKAKSAKNNFLYVPKPDSSIEDVTMKLLGSACSDQCQLSLLEVEGMRLTAFLPNPTADAKKVTGPGTFISVDGRPVSPKRGTLKQIVSIFREALRAVNHAFQNAKDVFFYLDISCGDMAYDPNIEPTKDDVLFENPDAVIQAAKTLIDAIYDYSNVDQLPEPTLSDPAGTEALDEFEDSLLEVRSALSLNRRTHTPAAMLQTPSPPVPRQLTLSHEPDSTPRLSINNAMRELDEIRQANGDVQTSNPWIRAKLNAPTKRSHPGSDENAPPRMRAYEVEYNAELQSHAHADLATPRASSPPFAREQQAYLSHLPHSRSSGNPATGNISSSSILGPSSSPRMVSLPSGTGHRPQIWPSSVVQQDVSRNEDPTELDRRKKPSKGNGLPFQKHSKRRTNQLFKPPTRTEDEPPLWFGRSVNNTGGPTNEVSSPLVRRQRGIIRQGEPDEDTAAGQALNSSKNNRDIRDFVGSVDLNGEDQRPSRQPLTRQVVEHLEHAADSSVVPRPNMRRPSRRRSSRLPLERIPAGIQMHQVFCQIKIDMDAVLGASCHASDMGSPVPQKIHNFGPREVDHIASMVQIVLLKKYPTAEFVDDFDGIVHGALLAWSA